MNNTKRKSCLRDFSFWLGHQDSEPRRTSREALGVGIKLHQRRLYRVTYRQLEPRLSPKYPQAKQKGHRLVSFSFWLGHQDSNLGNDGVRVRCLTAWRCPIAFNGRYYSTLSFICQGVFEKNSKKFVAFLVCALTVVLYRGKKQQQNSCKIPQNRSCKLPCNML